MSKIKKQTYSDQVVHYIKEGILKGEFQPGSKVKEVELAHKLSISRAPIREALQILAKEGLIVSKPQKGKYVTTLTAKQIKDSYFTGGILEGAAVAAAMDRYTEEDITGLERLVQEMKAIAETKAPIENFAKLDNEFHGILFSRINNDLVYELCHRSCQGISKFLLFNHWIKLYTAHEIYQRHLRIVNALKKNDPIYLENTIREHYLDSGDRMSHYGVDVYEE
ncbi:transcriptional regulator (GntR family protein) [Desulforapulum autotrophicum HRM2]|uniref:Transcriptional regulator (GntR family protein) n=1 Tax=Desulforapulum autotrophicum (strain ATCC 43914 / DSM 3382 / VKM B-1955 / HRM2) TaxID=177437 RepID=C0QA87_DESAH|nr:GntR family transcriptional regulator [Desulforapulum autotrophicum]ACN14672.1 transcriptional regulator (GntR family protein) [Desulforapulum autotrophicum HRM2]